MITHDFIRLTTSSVFAQGLRSALTALGIAIGIMAVVLLTAIGQGIHRYVLNEFTQFGTNLISIQPGRSSTMGASIGAFGNTRPLSLEDAESLKKLPRVVNVDPVVAGNALVEANGRQRRTNVYGVGPHFPSVFNFAVSIGNFLPPDEPRTARAFAVLGSQLRHELYGDENPLGQTLRVGGDRYRIIGVMHSKGQVLGFDIDDTVYIPSAKALDLFNRDGLMEINVLYQTGANVNEVAAGIKRILTARHGREDFTLITQEQMLDVLGSVLDVLTFAVGALGSISLLVGGIGIFTIMTIAVRERTPEIGLLRAVGAQRSQVLSLFLGEAILLAAIGGFSGLLLGLGLAWMLGILVPALPIHINWAYVLSAEIIAAAVGLIAGIWPARQAARLDPVEALRTE
ncbi:MAG: ABC transporter permease [Thiohalomonadaceae bacterium]